MRKYIILLSVTLLFVTSCNRDNNISHASGIFETEDIIVSAKSTGEIISFNVAEGDFLQKDSVIGQIDNSQLQLQKLNLQNAIYSANSKIINMDIQIAPIDQEIATLKKEMVRFTNLVKSNAANQKQLDDIVSSYNTALKKRSASYETMVQNNNVIENEINGLKIQIAQVEDNIEKSVIKSPINGMVITKYANAFEFVQPGKPLFKMADMSSLILRAYITADILTQVKVGDTATVLADYGKSGTKKYEGRVVWISDEAEFTPKTIPSRDERTNLVYATKISIKNDGYIRKGMYGEIIFDNISKK